MNSLLSSLPSVVTKKSKRLGRGAGSGKGFHTVGRGQKGQKSRTKISPGFMGTKVKKSLLQRLPLMRGKGKFKSLTKDTVTIALDNLETMAENGVINKAILVKKKIVSETDDIKVVANGKIANAVKVELRTSAVAKKMIEQAGGEVVE